MLGKISNYQPTRMPVGVSVGNSYTVSLLYDTATLGNTRSNINGFLFTGGTIKIGDSFSYNIGDTNDGRSVSKIDFLTAGNGVQTIDLNFGTRQVNPRDYVYIRLQGAANTLFNDTKSVFNFDTRPTVSVAGSYISFVVDQRVWDVRGNADAITCDEPQPEVVDAVPEPASWAMLILGMGAVGATMRRRSVATRISFAG